MTSNICIFNKGRSNVNLGIGIGIGIEINIISATSIRSVDPKISRVITQEEGSKPTKSRGPHDPKLSQMVS